MAMLPNDIAEFFSKSENVVMTSEEESIIPVTLAANGTSEPCKAMEMSTIQKTILKMSCVSPAFEFNIIMANTMEAAPLRPTNDTSPIWLSGYFLKGANTP